MKKTSQALFEIVAEDIKSGCMVTMYYESIAAAKKANPYFKNYRVTGYHTRG